MKKVLNILILLCILSAYSFAQLSTNMQTMINNLDMSAKKRATAGEFSSDSDKLNAKNVFDLNRIIFSAGYVPNLNSSSNQVIQAFFGVPILNNAMYFGFAGAYAMSETRSDYANESIAANSPNYLGKKVTNASSFAIRPVLKINDMVSIHYMIARGGVKSSTNGYTSYIDGDNFRAITNSVANTEWVHEVAVGLKFGEMKFKIPLRFYIDNNSYTKTYSREISGNFVNDLNYGNSENITASTNGGNSPVQMILAPEFYMPLVSGPMTGINAALTLGFDIYNPYKKTSYYTNATTETKNETGTYRNTDNSSSVTEMKKILDKKGYDNIIKSYEFKLGEGTITDKISISIPCGTEYNGKKVIVLHKKSDGTYEEFITTVKDGNATIEVTELSPFMVAINNDEAATLLSNVSNNAQTSSIDIVLLSILSISSLSGIIYLVLRKKKIA